MAIHGDDDTVVRLRPKSSLVPPGVKPGGGLGPKAAAAADTGQEAEPGERLIALPEPGSAYDAAYARPNNKPLTTLRFVIGDKVRGLPYANLDSIDWEPAEKPGGGPVIVLLFAGVQVRKAVIAGRHMLLMYDLLCDHRLAWVRELPKGRDFKDRDATVITGITIKEVES